jgi:eukaryotic translation initiation factor 2C
VVFRRQDKSIPQPDDRATTVEDGFQKNKSGSLNIGGLSLVKNLPVRPAYGTKGEKVILFANCFELSTVPDKLSTVPEQLSTVTDLILYRYSVHVQPEVKGRKLSQVIRLLLELPEYATLKGHLVSDFKSTMICRKKLSKTMAEYQIPYRSEGEDDARPTATTYIVTVKNTGDLNVAQLVAFLTSTSIDLAYADKDPTIQALNIFKSHFFRASPAKRATIGANKSFSLQQTTEADLGAGLTALRGYFSSVRVAAARILVNINVIHAPFYKKGSLLDVMRDYKNSVGEGNLPKVDKFIRKLRVKVIHMTEKKNRAGESISRIKTIFGLANQSDGHTLAHPPIVPKFGADAHEVKFFLINSARSSSKSTSGSTGQSEGKGGGKKNAKSSPELGQPSRSGSPIGSYVSVYDYFTNTYPGSPIKNPNVPVVNVGNRVNPTYLPAEVCVVEPGQSSISKLSPQQTTRMISFAVRKPWENAESIVKDGPEAIGMTTKVNTLLANFGISMNGELVTVRGRVLPKAMVTYKNDSVEVQDGAWNMKNDKFYTASILKKWTPMIINEGGSSGDDPDLESLTTTMELFVQALKKSGIQCSSPELGDPPLIVRSTGDFPRIEARLKEIAAKSYQLVLVVLPTANTITYDYIKTSADIKHGIHTICVIGSKFIKNQIQYFNNVSLKFNLKLGGANQIIKGHRLDLINEGKTMVIGIDVTHPSPGSASNAPSVAAMAASTDRFLSQWPVALRVQTRREEMVADLGAMLKGRLEIWRNKNKLLPENLLIYRDGVSEGQYDLVLDQELPLLRKACAGLYPATDTKKGLPRFTIIICGKRHHTRFFASNPQDADRSGNPINGTVVDRGITDPHLWDFYLQAHTAIQGTARSCHYIVVLDEILRGRPIPKELGPGATVADVLENMTYCMCHLFGRATKSVSLCPPAKYADIACERARKYLSELFDMSQAATPAASSVGGRGGRDATDEDVQVHPRLRDTMFYI